MKKKLHFTGKKLDLGKATVVTLNTGERNAIQGGATVPENGCAGSNHCPTIVACFVTQKCITYPYNEQCAGSNYCTITP